MTGIWWTKLLDFISPRQCVICGERLAATESTVCSVCLLQLPRTGWQYSPDNNPMAHFFTHLPMVKRCAAFMFFSPRSEIASVVYDLKYHNRPDIGEDMGRIIGNEMQMAHFFDGIDLLLPVPLSRKRLRQRGYNQSQLLAVGISDVTSLPVVSKALRRKHFLVSQTKLNHYDRQANVSGIFELKDDAPLRNKHVLLIDDVCTTGATLLACVDTIKDVEGIQISLLTLGFTKE